MIAKLFAYTERLCDWIWAHRRATGWGLLPLMVGIVVLFALPQPWEPVVGCQRSEAWQHEPWLLRIMVASDLAIFWAYCWIPREALRLRARLDVPVGAAFLGTAAFVVSCGLDHLTDVITTFYPYYWASAEKRAITASISLAFAAAVQHRLAPQIIAYVEQARADREALEQSVDSARRRTAEAERAKEELAAQREIAIKALEAQQEALTQLQEALAEVQPAKEAAEAARAAAVLLAEELERERAKEAQRATAAREAELEARGEVNDLKALMQTIDSQKLTITRLSTPIIDVWDGVLALPVVGIVDSMRASQMTEQLLARIVADQARSVIVDMTGVDLVDTMVAQHIVRLTKAVNLLGAQCIVTGLRPDVAQTLATAEFDVSQLRTARNLRDGLKLVLKAHR